MTHDEVLRQIGAMTLVFSRLEGSVQSLTHSLILEHQTVGQIITAELSFGQVRTLTMSLYLERNGRDDDFAQIKRFMDRAEKLEKRRNEIQHSVWVAGESPTTLKRMKLTARRRGRAVAFEEISAADLAGLGQEIEALGDEITSLTFDLIARHKVINPRFKPYWGPGSGVGPWAPTEGA
ncbi:MAG TPA: hypothetical protein VGL78_10270 [Solirubrobacteraceae bacterium]